MNADRSQEYFIDINGIRWQAIRIIQHVHIGGAYSQTNGFPYCPTKIFTSRVMEGMTLPQSWEYLDALENALVQAAEWEQEREAQS